MSKSAMNSAYLTLPSSSRGSLSTNIVYSSSDISTLNLLVITALNSCWLITLVRNLSILLWGIRKLTVLEGGAHPKHGAKVYKSQENSMFFFRVRIQRFANKIKSSIHFLNAKGSYFVTTSNFEEASFKQQLGHTF